MCIKLKYSSYQEALDSLEHIKSKRYPYLSKVYYCFSCECYHLGRDAKDKKPEIFNGIKL